MNGMEIGQITNKCPESADFFNESDFLSISFPLDLDVKMKAALIGACMLIVSRLFNSNAFVFLSKLCT